MVERRRRLKSDVLGEKNSAKQELEPAKLEISNAKQILFMFSFMNPKNLPRNLRKEEDDSDGYMLRRAKEVLEGGVSPEQIEVQRPANSAVSKPIMDTGYQMLNLTHVGGVEDIFLKLLHTWKVVDAHWKIKKSQQAIKSGNGHIKYQVIVVLSQKGEEAKLDDITCKDILRLMRMTWALHAWDNRHLPKKNIVLNFPACRGPEPAKNKLIL